MEIVVGRVEDSSVETRVYIEGVLDAVTVSEVRLSLEAAVDKQPRRVVVDLSRLRLIDSCGVGALVAIYKKARANDTSFAVSGATQQPLAILKLLNLDRVLGNGTAREITPRVPLAAERTTERLMPVPQLAAVAS